jgi:hypothetical protein
LTALILALAAAAAANVMAKAPSTPIILSTEAFIAEGVAPAADGSPLVSGVVGRTILKIDHGRSRPWLRPGRLAPLGALFGMAADRPRNRLWVAETFGAGLPGQSGPTRLGLIEVELSSGRVIARHAAPEDGRKRTIGDVAVTADGNVYASDSIGGGLYRLDRSSGTLRLLDQAHLRSAQGMVPTRDGAALIVADYPSGLHRLDLATGKKSPLSGDGARLRGLDRLARFGDTLSATQNGGSPIRILRLRLSADERTVETVETLASGPDLIDDLSLGAVIGKRYVFVAHSQWSAAGSDGKVAENGSALLSSIELTQP